MVGRQNRLRAIESSTAILAGLGMVGRQNKPGLTRSTGLILAGLGMVGRQNHRRQVHHLPIILAGLGMVGRQTGSQNLEAHCPPILLAHHAFAGSPKESDDWPLGRGRSRVAVTVNPSAVATLAMLPSSV